MSSDYDTRLLGKTLTYVCLAHQSQIYEGLTANSDDQPYAFHPIRVAFRVQEFRNATLSEKMVALVHDLLEDTSWDLPRWFTPTERAAVHLVTRPEDMTYASYIHSIAEAGGEDGRIARVVKLADMKDNLIHAPTDSSLTDRYVSGINVIQGAMVENDEF